MKPKIIFIVGKTDCRALVLPLLRLLRYIGKPLLISDDWSYSRLYHGYKNMGEINGADIVIHTPSTALIDALIARDRYTHIVAAANSCAAVAGADLVVSARGRDMSMELGAKTNADDEPLIHEDDVVRVSAGTAFKDVVICYDAPNTKSKDLLLLRGGLDSYVYNCEESKLLYPFMDKELLKSTVSVLHSLFGELLNLSAEQIQTSLTHISEGIK